MSEGNGEKSQSKSDKFIDGCFIILTAVWRMCGEANKTRFYWRVENWVLYTAVVSFSYVTFIKGHYGFFLECFSITFIRPVMVWGARYFGYYQLLFMFLFFIGLGFFIIIGWPSFRIWLNYQKALNHLNLQSGLGHKPKILKVDQLDDNRTRLLVKSTGLGEERYRMRLDDLRAAAGQRVEFVKFNEADNTCIEVFLARNILNPKLDYVGLEKHLTRQYSFIVGQSSEKVVTECLEDVPHYLIAGSTGGGKSVSFKSILIGLLESSSRLQMYLFDFKRVEMNDFKGLPNVVIANEEHDAQLILEKLVKEMERRYKFLEEKGYKSIDPKRDDLDRIVVAIDECTDLTGRVLRSHPNYAIIEKAINSLEALSRKARACGIHLIFATQKVDRTSLTTVIQENIEGRLALRMNTPENSIRVLQNKMSYDLPSFPGRAIWKKGSSYTEVQCAYLSDEDVKTKVNKLIVANKFVPRKMFGLAKADQDTSENISAFGSKAEA